MTTENRTKRPNKAGRTILIVIFLLALVAGAYFFIRYRQQQNALATINDLELVAFQRKPLISSINSTGSVQPAQDALLVWQTSGRVGEVTVSVGSQVKQGDLLAALDESDLPLDILQARMEKLNAEQALENLESATALKREQLKADISNAQTSLVSLNTELSLLQDRVCTSWRLRNLQTDFDDAQTAYRDNPTELNLRALQSAQSALDFARRRLSRADCNLTDKIALQEETIASWQADLEKIKMDPIPLSAKTGAAARNCRKTPGIAVHKRALCRDDYIRQRG